MNPNTKIEHSYIPNIDDDALVKERDEAVGIINSIREVARNTVEINPVNYDHDQVEELNNGMIEIHAIVDDYLRGIRVDVVAALRAQLAAERAEKAVLRATIKMVEIKAEEFMETSDFELVEHIRDCCINTLSTTRQDALDGIRKAVEVLERFKKDASGSFPILADWDEVDESALTKLKEIFP